MQIAPLLVIVGETGSGKSALAIELAMRLNGEIICADSWTVRREVSIGTAKPSAAEQAAVPHHLLDIVGPDEDFTAAVFKRLAIDTIDEIAARGKLPIIVGGTGLYVDSVLYDYGFLPAGDRADRETLNALSIDQLLAQIRQKGLELGAIDTGNKRRLIRLLETGGAVPSRRALRENSLVFGITTEREVLRNRIENRTDTMITHGLEQETRQLVQKYGWGCEALKGIGYSQWQDYFNGTANIVQTRCRIVKATMDLAKRQRTWFKRSNSIHWISTPYDFEHLVELATTNLNK
ncbi:tRNA (adenosine(37)-N6)-dimethylallyltransferase MiaA [Candidatus Saccharibacteria bacterium]|nr:tRNA (adenosine(37)-N6)-dimethylallyltransferase MiaA [Candidatus Saccharibacteria bacterium]